MLIFYYILKRIQIKKAVAKLKKTIKKNLLKCLKKVRMNLKRIMLENQENVLTNIFNK